MKSLCICLAAVAALFIPVLAVSQTADTFYLNTCAQYWANKRLVPNVQMTVGAGPLTNPLHVFTGALSTDSTCSEIVVTLDSAAPKTGYWLIGEKKDTVNDYRNGLSVGDLICMSKHILGLEPLPPIVQFAADANRSSSITAFDITEFTRLLLGIYTVLPNAANWRVLSPECHFPGPADPFPTNPCPLFSVDPLADFEDKPAVLTAVKIGDVNGDYAFDGNYQPATTLDPRSLHLPDRALKAGETVDIPLYWKAPLYAEGIQFALRYNAAILEVKEIVPFANITADNWAVFPTEGLLTHVSSYVQISQPGDTLATIRFAVKSDAQLSEGIEFDTTALWPLYYEDCHQAGKIHLKYDAISDTKPQPALALFSPPAPNPFADQTNVLLTLERPCAARLEIRDITGRLTYKMDYDLPAGHHVLEIPPAAMPAGGMAVYSLTVGSANYTGKIFRM